MPACTTVERTRSAKRIEDMDRKLRNRILIFLLLAGVTAFVLIRLSGRQPVAKISAVLPVRENIVSSISSNGKVEPISPFVMRAQLDTFVEKIRVLEGQAVKKGQTSAGIERERCRGATCRGALEIAARAKRSASGEKRRKIG